MKCIFIICGDDINCDYRAIAIWNTGRYHPYIFSFSYCIAMESCKERGKLSPRKPTWLFSFPSYCESIASNSASESESKMRTPNRMGCPAIIDSAICRFFASLLAFALALFCLSIAFSNTYFAIYTVPRSCNTDRKKHSILSLVYISSTSFMTRIVK